MIIAIVTAVVVLALAVACGGGLPDDDPPPTARTVPDIRRCTRPRPLLTTSEMTALDERSYPELPIAVLRDWLYPTERLTA